MTQMNVVEAAYGGYKLDVNDSERIGRVSSEWFSRPADCLSELSPRSAAAPGVGGRGTRKARQGRHRNRQRDVEQVGGRGNCASGDR
jgi:hypothetical protein